MNFIFSQITGILVSLAVIASTQVKSLKLILALQLVCNGLGALSFILLGGFSGCGIYIVAVVQTLVFFILRKTDTKAPGWITYVFAAAYLICSALTYKSPYDILTAIAALLCAFGLAQELPSRYRILMCINGLIWIVYDISVGAYHDNFASYNSPFSFYRYNSAGYNKIII